MVFKPEISGHDVINLRFFYFLNRAPYADYK